ncbi:hypothetical protein C1645_806649 [Glomus cerebriforme]|uniref:Uncharacterized protein n=1 Tax=Glomus cerebriforme TaxID=658196 RepID=A0A397SUV5_9GLOM|nr:hypothetical protein C1645_806649 [Glomus cerebriforme]
METLYDELKLEIFRYTNAPISLILTNRNWYTTSQDPHTRAEWLLFKYGRAHALFHAVRLGNNFITETVVQCLISKGAILSRYFIQRLVSQFGKQDNKLIEMKKIYNTNVDDIIETDSWAASLNIKVFTKIMFEAHLQLRDIKIKGNDMELFHFLTAGTIPIHQASQQFLKNFHEIEDLILNKKFIPFPPRPRPLPTEHYPSIDGFENSRQIHLLSRAVLISPNIVKFWKQIGYHEVCKDLNDKVMKGLFLLLFPNNTSANWVYPTLEFIVDKLRTLVELGFELNDDVIKEIINLFETKINIIGELMVNSIYTIRGKSVSTFVEPMLDEISRKTKNTKCKKKRSRK